MRIEEGADRGGADREVRIEDTHFLGVRMVRIEDTHFLGVRIEEGCGSRVRIEDTHCLSRSADLEGVRIEEEWDRIEDTHLLPSRGVAQEGTDRLQVDVYAAGQGRLLGEERLRREAALPVAADAAAFLVGAQGHGLGAATQEPRRAESAAARLVNARRSTIAMVQAFLVSPPIPAAGPSGWALILVESGGVIGVVGAHCDPSHARARRRGEPRWALPRLPAEPSGIFLVIDPSCSVPLRAQVR